MNKTLSTKYFTLSILTLNLILISTSNAQWLFNNPFNKSKKGINWGFGKLEKEFKDMENFVNKEFNGLNKLLHDKEFGLSGFRMLRPGRRFIRVIDSVTNKNKPQPIQKQITENIEEHKTFSISVPNPATIETTITDSSKKEAESQSQAKFIESPSLSTVINNNTTENNMINNTSSNNEGTLGQNKDTTSKPYDFHNIIEN